jgi:hypothetical protein
MDIKRLSQALVEARTTHHFIEVEPYTPADFEGNEYCLFVKPELTDDPKRFERAATMMLERVEHFGQEIVAAAAMDAQYLERHRVIEEHYGVINLISRFGIEALSDTAKAALKERCGAELERGMIVLGAHQFLQQYPFFSAKALALFFDNLGSVKLGGGAHSAKANINGQLVLILNGFHPDQLERYIAAGSAIVSFVVRSSASWKSLRNDFTGSTHPHSAADSSIRGILFARQAYFELKEVTAGSNGVHVSAGPIEAMVEICRYMSNLDQKDRRDPRDTTFGQRLVEAGLGPDDIHRLGANPVVEMENKRVSVFDLTEEVDAEAAIQLVRSINAKLTHV